MDCLGSVGKLVVHLAVVDFEIPDSEIDYRFLGLGIDYHSLGLEIDYHFLGFGIDCLCLDSEIGLQFQDSAVLDSGRIDHFVDLGSQDFEKMDLLQTAAWLT